MLRSAPKNSSTIFDFDKDEILESDFYIDNFPKIQQIYKEKLN